jgi:hypothetical protein
VHFCNIENDAEIFPTLYTWKVAEKGFKIALMMSKLAMIILVKLFLKNKYIFFTKNHFEIQVRAILVCTLHSIKYGICEQNQASFSDILHQL